jgi:hypothetical protein
MRLLLIAALLGATTAQAGQLTARDPEGAPAPEDAFLIRYGAAPLEIACDGDATVRAIDVEPPPPALTWLENGPRPDAEPYPITVSLDVTPDGRATAVRLTTPWVERRTFERRTTPAAAPDAPAVVEVTPRAPSVPLRPDQLEASIATWRFAPGPTRRTGCRFELQPQAERLSEIDVDDLMDLGHDAAVFALAVRVTADRELIDPACGSLAPAALSFPDPARMPKSAPGRRPWAVLSFDVDPAGTVREVRTRRSSGEAGLSEAWGEALATSRFHPGPGAKACLMAAPGGSTLLPPPPPFDRSAHVPDDARCENGAARSLTGLLSPEFPPHYLGRWIEGRALVRYDVRPDGRVTGVRAVAAEPGWAFAEPAETVVGRATGPASEAGFKGCLISVRFALPE